MNPLPKRYLSDGVYVASGAYVGEFILTTENGISETNRIAMDPTAVEGFARFVADTKEHARREIAKEHPELKELLEP